jgi:hypothetical protein
MKALMSRNGRRAKRRAKSATGTGRRTTVVGSPGGRPGVLRAVGILVPLEFLLQIFGESLEAVHHNFQVDIQGQAARPSAHTDKEGQLAKNILLFADGTGNEGGLLPDESRTNVLNSEPLMTG